MKDRGEYPLDSDPEWACMIAYQAMRRNCNVFFYDSIVVAAED